LCVMHELLNDVIWQNVISRYQTLWHKVHQL